MSFLKFLGVFAATLFAVSKNQKNKDELIGVGHLAPSVRDAFLDYLRQQENEPDLEIDDEYESSYGNGIEVVTQVGDFLIFENFDKAQLEARQRVQDDMEEDPTMFQLDFIKHYYYITNTDIRLTADEEADIMADEYRDELEAMDDEDLFEEANEEMINQDDGGYISDEDYLEDLTKQKEALIDQLVEDRRDEVHTAWTEGLEDPIAFLVEEKGIYTLEDLLAQDFMRINEKDAAVDAVDTDGVAHFLSTYDGKEIKFGEGHVAYRTN